MKEFELPEFPLMEYELLNKIVNKFQNWHYIDFEPEDLVQEVMIILIEKREAWEKVREASKNYSLMKRSLQIYAARVYNNHIRNSLNFEHTDLSSLIQKQIKDQTGHCYEYYLDLPANEKEYVENVYLSEMRTDSRAKIAAKLNITNSRLNSIEFKIKQIARIEMKKTIIAQHIITEEF